MKIKIDNINQVTTKEGSLKDLLNKDIQIGSQFNLKKKQALFNDLHLLFHAGLDMKRVLELIVSEQKNKRDKELLNRIYEKVISGISLSEAFSQERDFSEYEVFSIKIGEESGRLSDVLFHLKNYYQKRIEQKRIVSSALMYPITTLLVAFSVVVVMIAFVVPTFAETFKTFGAKLPPLTQWLIDFSENFLLYTIIFTSSIGGLIITYQFVKKEDQVRKWKDNLLLRLPFTGHIYHLAKLTQFCENMKLLIGAKTSLIESLDLTGKMLTFYPIQSAIKQISLDITNGKTLNSSLSQFKIFPSRMTYLISVGEEVNQLENIFNQLSLLYGNELEHKSKTLGSVIGPFLLIFVAVIVGFIVAALYLPMFSLSELI